MAKLIINPTSSTRRETLLPRSLLSIGRDPSNDLVLPDAMVSRRHALVEYRGDGYTLRDCNSSNGSLVNGERVVERALKDGDVVAIGTARLLFRDDAVAVDAAGKVLRHPSARRAECPGCGAEFRVGDVYCRECGQQLAEPPALQPCPSCSAPLRGPARYCPSCGELLGDAAEGPQSAVDFGAATVLAGSQGALDVQPRPAPAPRHRPLLGTHPRKALGAAAAAGLGERALAGLLDLLIVAAGEALFLAPLASYWSGRTEAQFLPILLSTLAGAVALAAAAGYFVFYWGLRGATPGKRALGLAVESSAGVSPIGLARAGVRVLGYAVSAAFLGVGFLLIALDGDGLHDRIAATRVVKRR
jgi:uncharacterized RDD family membrane protein YckC